MAAGCYPASCSRSPLVNDATEPPLDDGRSPADARTSVLANAAAAAASIRLAPRRIRAFGAIVLSVLVCFVLQKYDFPVTATAAAVGAGSCRAAAAMTELGRGGGEGYKYIYPITQSGGKSVFVRLAIYRILAVQQPATY